MSSKKIPEVAEVKLSPSEVQDAFKKAKKITKSNPKKAVELLKNCIVAKPEMVGAHIELASSYVSLEEYFNAINICQVGLKISTKTEEKSALYCYLAHSHNALQQFSETAKVLQDVTNTMKNSTLYNLHTIALIQNKNFAESFKLATDALVHFPDDLQIRYYLGYSLLELRRTEEAKAPLNHVMYKTNDLMLKASAHNALATAEEIEGKFPIAILNWEQAMLIQPKKAIYPYNIGKAYEKKGNFEVADKYYQDALVRDPGFAPAHFSLVFSKIKRGQLQVALPLMKKTFEELIPHYQSLVIASVQDFFNDKDNFQKLIRFCEESWENLAKVCTKVDPRDLELETKAIKTGGFSTVFVGKVKGTKSEIAAKRMTLDMDSSSESKIRREIMYLWLLNHSNLIQFKGWYQNSADVFIISEKAENDLKGYFENYKRLPGLKITPPILKDIALQFLRGLSFIHSFRLAHRDLKPQNILVFSTKGFAVKIADYGTLRTTFGATTRTDNTNTIQWAAPELLFSESSTVKVDAVLVKVDIFSVGYILWYLWKQIDPYKDEPAPVIAEALRKWKETHTPPFDCEKIPWIEIMKRCWNFDPSKRPTTEEIIQEIESISL